MSRCTNFATGVVWGLVMSLALCGAVGVTLLSERVWLDRAEWMCVERDGPGDVEACVVWVKRD